MCNGNQQEGDRVNVDDFEDARFPEFDKAQQRSISCAHLIETECIEDKLFSGNAVNRLGRRGSGVHHVRDSEPAFSNRAHKSQLTYGIALARSKLAPLSEKAYGYHIKQTYGSLWLSGCHLADCRDRAKTLHGGLARRS